jgi:hypothetical protein
MNVVGIVLALALLVGPQQPPAPAGNVEDYPPRVYLPLLIGQDTGVRTVLLDVVEPGIWIHVKFLDHGAKAMAHALVFNPDHTGGLWTVLSPIDEGWHNIRYRLEWGEVPAWTTPEAWQPVLDGASPGYHPEWWHEQRKFEIRGSGFMVDHYFRDLP